MEKRNSYVAGAVVLGWIAFMGLFTWAMFTGKLDWKLQGITGSTWVLVSIASASAILVGADCAVFRRASARRKAIAVSAFRDPSEMRALKVATGVYGASVVVMIYFVGFSMAVRNTDRLMMNVALVAFAVIGFVSNALHGFSAEGLSQEGVCYNGYFYHWRDVRITEFRQGIMRISVVGGRRMLRGVARFRILLDKRDAEQIRGILQQAGRLPDLTEKS